MCHSIQKKMIIFNKNILKVKMAELKGQQVQFFGSKSYVEAVKESNGNIYFTTDENGSIVVNGKVYGTVDSNLMSTPTSGNLKKYIDDVANTASGETSYALEEAKKYADGLINALDVTDNAVDGKYVSAVSEENGKIKVTRADLPVLSGGATGTDVKPVKSVTVSGHTITVTTVAENLATEADLTKHINDNVKHITSYERAAWNNAAESINAFLKDSYMGGQAIDTLIEIQQFLDGDVTGTAALTQTLNKSAKSVTLSNTSSVDWSLSTDKKYIGITQTVTTTANDDTTTDSTAYLRIPTADENNFGVVALKQDGGLYKDANGHIGVNPEYKMTYALWADNAIEARHAEEAEYAYNAENARIAQYANNATNSMYANCVATSKGLIYNIGDHNTEAIENGKYGQILTFGRNDRGDTPIWTSDLSYDITIGGKEIATEDYVEDYVSYQISKVNQNTGSISSYVEALSSEVQTISNDVDTIKSYLLWQ